MVRVYVFDIGGSAAVGVPPLRWFTGAVRA
jgi:hypothetical protein